MSYPSSRSTPGVSGDLSETPVSSDDPVRESAGEPSFDQFGFCEQLHRNIAAAGYKEPRPIQSASIPAALEGRDVLGLAQTGTGKTAAFALPILERILSRPGRGPRALVIAPTRELALQIEEEFLGFARSTRVKTVCVYGGVSERTQISKLRRRPDVVIACPGRLLDLMGRGEVTFESLETLVLDEADHMFDMGFLPDIRRIIRGLPHARQNLLFAATMPPEIRGLADVILEDPWVVELANTRPAETIAHALYPVEEKRKVDLLNHLLDEDGFYSAIVFTRTKYRAKRLALKLTRNKHKAIALQGNMSQAQRDRAMQGFRDGKFYVLVATDIVSRGIDVDQVSHVINYDIPGTPEAYTHRIGRTGRAERSGKAYTFVTADDVSSVHAIERKIGARIPRVRVEGFEGVEIPAASTRGGGSSRRSGKKSRGGGGGEQSRSGRPTRRGRRDFVGDGIRDDRKRRNRSGSSESTTSGNSKKSSRPTKSRRARTQRRSTKK